MRSALPPIMGCSQAPRSRGYPLAGVPRSREYPDPGGTPIPGVPRSRGCADPGGAPIAEGAPRYAESPGYRMYTIAEDAAEHAEIGSQ